MYDAEVLSKFPVVQHFPFGSLFSFERDGEVEADTGIGRGTVHLASQPRREGLLFTSNAVLDRGASPYSTATTNASPSVRAGTNIPAGVPSASTTMAPWARPGR